MTIEELRQLQIQHNEIAQAKLKAADEENRDLTDEEQQELDQALEEFERLDQEITRRETVQNQQDRLNRSLGRRTDPETPRNQVTDEDDEGDDGDDDEPPAVTPPRRTPQNRPNRRRQPEPNIQVRNRETPGKWGFKSFGEFACSVRMASVNGGQLDDRLRIRMAPSTYGSEGVGADGGFAVPPDFRQAIVEKVMGETALISRTDQLISNSNSITVPVDNTTPWQSTGGIQAFWEGEGQQKTQSKPNLDQSTIRLNKLVALVPVTDELLEDAPSMDQYLRRKAPEKIDFKINRAIIAGTGVGQPLGILESPATVVVAKESAQAADTILFKNIVNMWSRMYAPSRANAVWIVNQDIEPQLMTMSFEGTSSSVPAYMPANGLAGSPFSTLMGRPVIPTQAANVLGDKGDIILADLSQYMTATRGGGVRTDVSIHLWFDYDMTAFRFVLRVAGQPWFNAAIDPRSGSTTLGTFITLAERA